MNNEYIRQLAQVKLSFLILLLFAASHSCFTITFVFHAKWKPLVQANIKSKKKKSVEYLFDQIWVREFILSGSRAIFIVLY